jgi:hypothetical protein
MAYGNGSYKKGGNYGKGGGSNFSRGNNAPKRPSFDGADQRYVRASFFAKHLIFESEARDGERAPREPKAIEPGVTEEVKIVLNAERTQQLIQKLNDAISDPQGDGGVVLTAYLQHRINRQDNSEFDGASLMVLSKFPSKNNGSQGGRGNGGNGRKEYPSRNANSGTQQGGQTQYGRSTEHTTGDRGGNTHNAQSAASHSDTNKESISFGPGIYTESTGW